MVVKVSSKKKSGEIQEGSRDPAGRQLSCRKVYPRGAEAETAASTNTQTNIIQRNLPKTAFCCGLTQFSVYF